MQKRLLSLLMLLLFATSLFAQKSQQNGFTIEDFTVQLEKYLNANSTDAQLQQQNSKMVGHMRPFYESLSHADKKRFVDVYSYLVKIKMKKSPEMTSFISTMLAYITDDAYSKNFNGWLQGVEVYVKAGRKSKTIMKYVDFTQSLLDQRLLHSTTASRWWLAEGTTYKLVVLKGKPMVKVDSPCELFYASKELQNVIHNTTGVYDYEEGVWMGKGGKVDWTRTGLSESDCYATLSSYTAETKLPAFKADSVSLVNSRYFQKPIVGKLIDTLKKAQAPEKYSFPRFRSYQNDFVIKDIVPDVDYSGPFMMNGSKFTTSSSKHPGSMIFRMGGTKKLSITSKDFTVTKDLLSSKNAIVALYIGENDSISNGGIVVRYSPQERRVTMVNETKRSFYSPFVDSYHGFDLYCESITWKVDGTEVEMTNLSGAGTMNMITLESSSYYTFKKYREIQGIETISPIQRVHDYAKIKGTTFGISGFGNFIGMGKGEALLMVHNLCRHGLVSYNSVSEKVTVLDKLEDYLMAFSKKTGFDYDAISLESTSREVNVVLNTENNEMLVRGIDQFVVSDSQQVVVYPKGKVITVGKNRAIRFNGRIDAGKFRYFVSNANFSYEKFMFDMPTIDSMFFYVAEFDNPDVSQLVKTPLYGLVGELLVDKPDNHCGLVKNKEYPIFNSKENTRIFFDQKEIENGEYDRERFYYTLHPFTLNSLVNFVPDSMKFVGVLTSANIFPDIEYPLSVQRDYYLGFQTTTPAGGYPAYGGKGTYFQNISLDHYGLRGSGELVYLTSHSTSKDFLFLPDSMLVMTDNFYVKEEGGFPDIRNSRTLEHWLPYKDSMSVSSLADGEAFKMYHDDAMFVGRIDLQPQGASGDGTADVLEGTLKSHHFELLAMEMNANVSDFVLHGGSKDVVAMTLKDVKSHVDYEDKTTELVSNTGIVRTPMPPVQYLAYADKFVWDMDKKEVTMSNSERQSSEGLDGMDIRQRLQKVKDMPGVRMVSTDAAQGNLSYYALQTTYRYLAPNFSAKDVFLLTIADAAIAPNKDSLYVGVGGKMQTLLDASMVCDTANAYHLITKAELTIQGGNSFVGNGYINYVDDNKQEIPLKLDNISVAANGHTLGVGTIKADANFKLSSAFGFSGNVRVEGDKQYLFFDGGIRLVQQCIPADRVALLSYADYTDPEHVHVVVPKNPTDPTGNRITASIIIDPVTLKPNAAFLTTDKVQGNELLPGYGVLTYISSKNQYLIASEEKIEDPDAVVAPYLALSTTDCTVEGEGPMNFAMRRTNASFFTYGTANVGINNEEYDNITTTFGMNFPLDKKVLTALAEPMQNDLRMRAMNLKTNKELRHAMIHYLGEEEGEQAYNMLSSTGHLDEVPMALRCTMLFDNIRWQYSPTMGLYYDGKAGLISVDEYSVGVDVKLKAQIYKRGQNQMMVFYVQPLADMWYYFSYDIDAQELTIYSSDQDWLNMIKAIPVDKRKISNEGLGTFRYFVGNNSSEVRNWIENFSRGVYDTEEE